MGKEGKKEHMHARVYGIEYGKEDDARASGEEAEGAEGAEGG